MKNSILRKLKCLLWAETDIRAARELCEHLIHKFEKLKSRCIRRAIQDGVIISYARPFGRNRGLGTLPTKFSEFDDEKTLRFHKRMLSARHYVAAHHNVRGRTSLLSPQALQAGPDKILIEVQSDGQTEWEIKAPALDSSVLREVVKLCRLQEQRINAEARRILSEVSRGHSYAPRLYTLGENFP